jgi:hypothetical protein
VKRRRKRLLELEHDGDKRSHGSGIYSEGAGVDSEGEALIRFFFAGKTYLMTGAAPAPPM